MNTKRLESGVMSAQAVVSTLITCMLPERNAFCPCFLRTTFPALAAVETGRPIRGEGAAEVVVRTLRVADGRRLTFLRNAGSAEARLEDSSLPEFTRELWGGSRIEGGVLAIPAGEFAVLI
jgi:hypothetical protein